jgi:hypothetical protein
VSAWCAVKTCLAVSLVVGAPGYAWAQSPRGVGIVTTLVGEATVARAALVRDQILKRRDDVFPDDRISTKERSLVHVLMGGKALLTVRELSVLEVTEEGGRVTVNLQSGKIGLAIVRTRMQPGETIEVHTPHAVAAVRGTVLVVEVVPGSGASHQPDGGTATNIHLLHGKLDVSLRSDPTAAPVHLESLQTVTVSSHALGPMRPLSPAAAAAATASLKIPPPPALPEQFQATLGERQRVLAVTALARAGGSGAVGKAEGARARAEANTGAEARGGSESADVVSDAGGGVRPAGGSALDLGHGGVLGSGLGNGFSSRSAGSSNAQGFGPGPGPLGHGLPPIVPNLPQKKGK